MVEYYALGGDGVGVPLRVTKSAFGPMLLAMFLVMIAVIAFPQLALWLPARLGY